MSKKYKYRYTIEYGKFDKSDIKNSNQGLTDEILITSTVYDSKGNSSLVYGSMSKEGEKLSPLEEVKQWAEIGKILSQAHEKTLPEKLINILRRSFRDFKKEFLKLK